MTSTLFDKGKTYFFLIQGLRFGNREKYTGRVIECTASHVKIIDIKGESLVFKVSDVIYSKERGKQNEEKRGKNK